MKTIATLIFVLFIGVTAQAQNASEEVKVETVTMAIVVKTDVEKTSTENKVEIARLYKRPNARVKKALTFTTKRNRPKMA
ncbi:hypothetical protein [Pseudozobellia thermophila]|uniref:Uncharacterized protein n=1 Tax=Pseudozobellia thermophila TaxID=192903 RepID=A0A1M6HZG1_9FLAO|nr:hypothetical protein [Pseudozobellia thermophila]SHJ27639.1 hypothetical protein SAMN04488513_103258 [Pseudozobellia thermophila]